MIKLLFLAFAIAFFPAMLFAQWHELPGPSAGAVNDLCEIAGSNGGEIYAATPNGVYRTTDHAKTWQLMGLKSIDVQKLTQYVTSNAEILLAIVPGNLSWKICRSADSARTWDTLFVMSRRVSYQNYYGEYVDPILALVQEGNDVLTAVSGPNSDTTAGIYRSKDIGQTWTHQAFAPSEDGILFDFTLGSGLILGIANDTVWSLPSHETTWQVTSYPNWHKPHSLKFFGDDLFVGGSGRIDISTNNGMSWLNPANNGLDTVHDVISTFAVNGLTIIATGGYGAYRSTNGGVSWAPLAGSRGNFGGYPRIWKTNNIELFGTVFFSATMVGVFTSPDGVLWTLSTDGIIGGTIQIAHYDSTLFATTLHGIFRSRDRGRTWMVPSGNKDLVDSEATILENASGSLYALGNALSGWGGLWRWDGSEWDILSDQLVYSVAKNSATLFVSTPLVGILSSSDSGITWTPANSGIPLDSGTVETVLAVGETMLAFMQTGSIYESNNDGILWNWHGSIPSGMGVGPASAVLVSGKIYAACDSIFISNDTGANWTNLGIRDGTSRISLWPLQSEAAAAAADGLYLIGKMPVKLLNDSVSPYYFDAFASDDSLAYVAVNLGNIYATQITTLSLAVSYSPRSILSLHLTIFPNPTNGHATIAFTLPKRESISLQLFDARGVKVATYFNGIAGPGEVQVPIDATGILAGSYIAVLKTPEGSAIGHVSLLQK